MEQDVQVDRTRAIAWPSCAAQVVLDLFEKGQQRVRMERGLSAQRHIQKARLVEQLLTLSRLESGAAPTLATVDLDAVVRQVVAELAPQALAKRQTIAVTPAEACSVEADALLLSVLVRNLVDNAIRYSPADAKVTITISSAAGDVRLSVDDSGPGMTEGDRSRLGERFFRVLGSGQTGSGLGWSIAQRIAHAHGATMSVARSSALGGLSVGLKFPLRPRVATTTHRPVGRSRRA